MANLSLYLLDALIYLGLHRDELVTIQQIAEGYGISKNHLMKIINRLSQDGLIESVTDGLKREFGIGHPTIQVERTDCDQCEGTGC